MDFLRISLFSKLSRDVCSALELFLAMDTSFGSSFLLLFMDVGTVLVGFRPTGRKLTGDLRWPANLDNGGVISMMRRTRNVPCSRRLTSTPVVGARAAHAPRVASGQLAVWMCCLRRRSRLRIRFYPIHQIVRQAWGEGLWLPESASSH